MAQDNTDKFKRPLPLRQNERLRESLNAPQFEGFPVEGLAPSNRQPQKSSSTKKPINRGEGKEEEYITLEDDIWQEQSEQDELGGEKRLS